MRRNTLILIVALVIVAASGIVLAAFFFGPASASITSVTTDKDLYHSKETMKITVSLGSQGNMGNTTLRFLGLQDRHGAYQLDQEIPIVLSPGPNTVIYTHPLPSCSSCSGLTAGNYPIEVSLSRDGVPVSNMTHTIQLEQ